MWCFMLCAQYHVASRCLGCILHLLVVRKRFHVEVYFEGLRTAHITCDVEANLAYDRCFERRDGVEGAGI